MKKMLVAMVMGVLMTGPVQAWDNNDAEINSMNQQADMDQMKSDMEWQQQENEQRQQEMEDRIQNQQPGDAAADTADTGPVANRQE